MTRSRFHASKAPDATGGNLGWDHVAALAKISLVETPNTLGEAAIAEQRQALVAAADRLLGSSRSGATARLRRRTRLTSGARTPGS